MTGKIRILFFIECMCNGGAERVTAYLANYFSEIEKYEVFLCKYISTENEYEVKKNVTQFTWDGEKKTGLSKIISKVIYSQKIISEVRPHVIISLAMYKINILLAFFKLFHGYRLILSERNDPDQFPKKRYQRIIRNISYLYADKIVFQTEDARDYFCASIRKKAAIIGNPVVIPDKYGFVEKKEKYIINCSRLDKQKNLELLISAFKKISQKYPDYNLRIYGRGAEKTRLKEFIKENNLENRVFLCGYSSEILSKVARASVFVSSSDYEGMSNSMLESLALGTPTICTDCPVGGARQVIKSGENGILVPIKDKEKLADAMDYLLSNKEKALLMGKAAMRIRKDHGVKNIARKWENIVKRLLRDQLS